MPKTKKTIKAAREVKVKYNFKQSWASIFIGAIVVVILGLLVASIITKNQGQIDNEAVRTNQADNSTNVINPQTDRYQVAEGDSLSEISMKYYGTYDYWPVLAKVNKIFNPNIINVGVKLEIPTKIEAQKMNVNLTTTSYDVASGDTLFDIAQKLYGDGTKWRIIANANKVGYLPNGNPLIFAGNKLIIPR